MKARALRVAVCEIVNDLLESGLSGATGKRMGNVRAVAAYGARCVQLDVEIFGGVGTLKCPT